MYLWGKFKCLLLLILFFCSMPLYATVVSEIVAEHAIIMVNSAQAKQPIQLRKVKIDGVIFGSFAKTQVELTLYNPNNIDLEGQLAFPLIAGQTVTGFALDINGKLRDAVAVEKAFGQQVFEEVTRKKVDPALLEKTSTNFYKLRVYPIAAQGTRIIRLKIEQNLSAVNQHQLSFQFPLMFAEKIQRLQAKFTVNQLTQGVQAFIGAHSLTVSQNKGNTEIVVDETNHNSQSAPLQIKIPKHSDQMIISTQKFQGQTYFYAQIPEKQLHFTVQPRAIPQKIAIVWDASASAQQRDHLKEFDLLAQYFQKIQNVEVELLTVRDHAEVNQSFRIKHGDWQQLRRVLEKMVYDGATNAGAIKIPEKVDLALLFSDGIFNFGSSLFPDSNIPLYAVSTSLGAHDVLLRQLANRNGGAYLDLLKLPVPQAVHSLQSQQAYVTQILSRGVDQLNLFSPVAENGYYFVTGILSHSQASLYLKIKQADGSIKTDNITLNRQIFKQDDFAAYAWAKMSVQKLSMNTYLNQAKILRLGKRFSLLTKYTSLIVLDDVSDYVHYEIEPPAELSVEYRRQLVDLKLEKKQTKQKHLEQVIELFQRKQAWWDQKFPKDKMPNVPKDRPDDSLRYQSSAHVYPRMKEVEFDDVLPSAVVKKVAIEEAVSPEFKQDPTGSVLTEIQTSADKAQGASIHLKKWSPDEPYIKRLKAAKLEDLYAIYLDERADYVNSSAFYLDVSDFLFAHGKNQLALRVLSNLAEMGLENRQVLRILGYRLLQNKQYHFAIPVFERVKQLSPNEPQSWRDLALALNQAGQKQQAIDQLWEVVSTPWSDRFPQIELIALAELNAIIATAPNTLSTHYMDKRLLRNLPLDLRAILTWDQDNTDIDLWVTDPNGEKAFYGHALTYQGGRMSPDFTQGYGPEVFSLRHAMPGKYLVEAQFYGHNQQIVAPATTIMLTLTTHFGKKNQKDEQVILRLNGAKEKIVVGEFVIQ